MNGPQIFLQRKFEEIRGINPRFSQRAFAKKAGLSSGAMCSIMSGKRILSKELATRISLELGLTNDELKEFMSDFLNSQKDQEKRQQSLEYALLQTEHYRMINQWHHLALLNLINCSDFKPDIEWMALRLNISSKLVSESLNRMINLGIIIFENDTYKRGALRFHTSDGTRNLHLKAAHKEGFRKASEALDKVDIDKRHMTAVTMAIDPSLIPAAKKRIREFIDDLSQELENGNQTEVYKMAIQLFPLTSV